jgi:hypothetical protein
MSNNPYAPPTANLETAGLTPALAGRGDFDLGQCFSEAWANTWANFGTWLGTYLVWGIATLAAALTGIGLIFLVPVLFWGVTVFTLRLHDGGAELRDAFSGFSRYGQALATMLAMFVILMLVSLLGQSVDMIGSALDDPYVRIVGVIVNLAFGLFVTPRLNFSYLLAVDRNQPALDAVRRSWEGTARAKWKVAALALLSGLVVLGGALVLLVGVIPASVIASLMWVSAYRQIFGGPAAA